MREGIWWGAYGSLCRKKAWRLDCEAPEDRSRQVVRSGTILGHGSHCHKIKESRHAMPISLPSQEEAVDMLASCIVFIC